jgi:hypothetical protein
MDKPSPNMSAVGMNIWREAAFSVYLRHDAAAVIRNMTASNKV